MVGAEPHPLAGARHRPDDEVLRQKPIRHVHRPPTSGNVAKILRRIPLVRGETFDMIHQHAGGDTPDSRRRVDLEAEEVNHPFAEIAQIRVPRDGEREHGNRREPNGGGRLGGSGAQPSGAPDPAREREQRAHGHRQPAPTDPSSGRSGVAHHVSRLPPRADGLKIRQERSGILVSRGGRLSQQPEHDPLQRPAASCVERPRRLRLLTQDGIDHRGLPVAAEGPPAGHHLVEHDAERP